MEGGPWRGPIHQPPIRGLVLGSSRAGRSGERATCRQNQKPDRERPCFPRQSFPFSQFPCPISANGHSIPDSPTC